MEDCLMEAVSLLQELIEEHSISKNIKKTMTEVVTVLQEENELAIKCDKAIQILTIGEDPTIDVFTKTRIWSLLSMLESIT